MREQSITQLTYETKNPHWLLIGGLDCLLRTAVLLTDN